MLACTEPKQSSEPKSPMHRGLRHSQMIRSYTHQPPEAPCMIPTAVHQTCRIHVAPPPERRQDLSRLGGQRGKEGGFAMWSSSTMMLIFAAENLATFKGGRWGWPTPKVLLMVGHIDRRQLTLGRSFVSPCREHSCRAMDSQGRVRTLRLWV